jgi:hypothetical protein
MTPTARRGHGEGSVYRDAANGTWVDAISLGWRPDGSRIRRKVTGRTKTEVQIHWSGQVVQNHSLRSVRWADIPQL